MRVCAVSERQVGMLQSKLARDRPKMAAKYGVSLRARIVVHVTEADGTFTSELAFCILSEAKTS